MKNVYRYLFKCISEDRKVEITVEHCYKRDSAPEIEELDADLEYFVWGEAAAYNYENCSHRKFYGEVEDITDLSYGEIAYDYAY